MSDLFFSIYESKEAFRYIGVVGSVVYIVSYAMLQMDYMKSSDISYSILQGVAAFLVLSSMIEAFNLSAFLIQICFLSLSIFGLMRRIYQHRAHILGVAVTVAFFNRSHKQLGRKPVSTL